MSRRLPPLSALRAFEAAARHLSFTRAAAKLARRHDARLEGRAWTRAGTSQPLRHAIEIRHESFRDPAFTGALLLGGIAVPTVVSVAEDALDAVPRTYREAAMALGATRWQTIWRIVLPNSISGILTGVILQVSRTAGETAPVMLTGVATYKLLEGSSLFLYHPIQDQCMALSMHLYYIATQANNVPHATPFAIATVWASDLRPESSTLPIAGRAGFARRFCISATSRIISSNRSRFCFAFAETGTITTSPPQSSANRPRSASCCLMRSGWASGLSILLIATIIGTFAAFA